MYFISSQAHTVKGERRPGRPGVDEAQARPRVVDGAHLVVHQAGVQAEGLHDLEAQVGGHPGCLLGPSHPEAAIDGQGPLGRREPAGQLGPAGGEQHDDVERGPQPGQHLHAAELVGEGGRGVHERHPVAGLHAQLLLERRRRVAGGAHGPGSRIWATGAVSSERRQVVKGPEVGR